MKQLTPTVAVDLEKSQDRHGLTGQTIMTAKYIVSVNIPDGRSIDPNLGAEEAYLYIMRELSKPFYGSYVDALENIYNELQRVSYSADPTQSAVIFDTLSSITAIIVSMRGNG